MSRLIIAALFFIFIFFMTASGAACVFLTKKGRDMQILQGASAGIMLAASFWSLLLPAFTQANELYSAPSFVITAAILLGAAFIFFLDLLCVKSGNSQIDRNKKVFWAVTLHNIPEGLAVGIAFGAAGVGITGAMGVAIAIGIQNFPEGLATAMPMLACGKSKKQAFGYSVLSGAVEPVFACVGFILAEIAVMVSPLALCFAAGAMVYVCASELIPEGCKTSSGGIAFAIGFSFMTLLDLLFG